MPYTLDAFCKDVKAALTADKGPKGREIVRQHLEKLLKNKDVIETHLGPGAREGRTTLYEDAELKFCVLAHVDRKPRASPPHDHGRSWAVYGQAIGWSEMSLWKRTDGGTGAGKAALEKIETYRIGPGEAGIFDVGAIHGVERSPGGCCYIRVTGEDLEVVPRLKYDLKAGQAITVESAGITAR